MTNFIEEFYYGNLEPQARIPKENKTVQKQMEVLMLNEDFLTENLSGESKKKFLEFCNAWSVVNGESNLDSFIMGFPTRRAVYVRYICKRRGTVQRFAEGGLIMEKYIYDENNGLWYELQGDYYIPCLKLPDEEQVEIGVWGQRHLEHIKHHRNGFYTALILDCKLNRYLADINEQAEEMFDTLIPQYKNAEGITEQLKADNQMEWVCKMNNMRDRINEIIYKELIYV